MLPVQNLKVIRSLLLWHCSWLIHWVEHEFAHVIHHSWNQLFHVVVWHAEVWIRIDLNKPYTIILINQKVEAEKFICSFPIFGIQGFSHTQKSVYYQVLHAIDEIALQVNLSICDCVVEMLLEFVEAEGIACFESFVLFGLILQALVRQVDVVVGGLQIVVV